MNLLAAKIYYDGSHWIAIPHTERPYRQRRRRKQPEKSEELQQFEKAFIKSKGKRKNRKAKLLREFTPMFKDEDEAANFVEQHFERLSRNRWERYKRMIRRGYTNRWNFFCTYTFDSRKHTEETFVYSRGLKTYFVSDVLGGDILCPMGDEEHGFKYILAPNFTCMVDGEIMGTVSPEVIEKMPKAN